MAEKKVVLYVEIPESLKERLARLAVLRERKLVAETKLAIRRYVEAEEASEGLEPIGHDDADDD